MMYEYIKSYDTNNTNPEMSKKKRDRRWAAYDYVRSWVGSIKHEPKYQTVWHPSDANGQSSHPFSSSSSRLRL